MRQKTEIKTRLTTRLQSGAQGMTAADGAGAVAGALAGALSGAAAVMEDSGTVLAVFDDKLIASLTPAGTGLTGKAELEACS